MFYPKLPKIFPRLIKVLIANQFIGGGGTGVTEGGHLIELYIAFIQSNLLSK